MDPNKAALARHAAQADALRSDLAASDDRIKALELSSVVLARRAEDAQQQNSILRGNLSARDKEIERLHERADESDMLKVEIKRLRELVKYAWLQAIEFAERDPGDDPEESFYGHKVSDLVKSTPKLRAVLGEKE